MVASGVRQETERCVPQRKYRLDTGTSFTKGDHWFSVLHVEAAYLVNGDPLALEESLGKDREEGRDGDGDGNGDEDGEQQGEQEK